MSNEVYTMSYEEAMEILNNTDTNIQLNIMGHIVRGEQQEALNKVKELTNCTDEISIKIISELNKGIAPLSPAEIARNRQEAQDLLNKPKCPTCNSTNLKKISTTSKVVNTAVFGIFGTKRFKQFHCNNCGYEW